MLNRIFVVEGNDSPLLPGAIVDIKEFKNVNAKIIVVGKKPAFGHPIILGIKKAPLESESFLAAASFQDTTRVLTNAVIKSKQDNLRGLKENVILGNLIPAGTGLMPTEKLIGIGNSSLEEEY